MAAETSRQGAAAGDDDVDIYPTGRIDNALAIKPMVLSVTMRFNDVLDAEKLRASLATLLQTGDWRRFAGRMRKPAPGDQPQVLRVHSPRVFTRARPPLAYSHADHAGSAIADHPLGAKLPALDGASAALWPSSEDFREFAAAEDLPDTVDGFLAADRDVPVLSLRVTSFSDATLVAVAFPHILMDAMAFGELMSAWCLVLAGREDEVPPVLRAKDDIMYEAADPALATQDEAPWVLQSVYLVGFSFFLFVVRFLWAVITERNITAGTIYIPQPALAKMRANAIADVAAAAPSPEDASKAWVSEGDVLFAWACRIVSLAQGTSQRPLNAHNAMNMRGRLPETTAPSTGGVFARNFITLSYIPVTPAEARGPLGLVAAKYRAALTRQAQATQALWTQRASRASVDAGKDANIVCGAVPTGELLSMTNWLKADYVRVVDFSPAVVKEASEGGRVKGYKPGKIVYLHSQIHERGPLVRNTLGAMAKDPAGGVWLGGFFPQRTWAVIEKELEEINKS